jgi:mRNA interferase YafQ
MLTPRYTSAFKKDFKRAQKCGWETGKLRQVIDLLLNEKPLPESCQDHPLRGKFAGTRDCHIEPDWLLIYAAREGELILHRTGTHTDLFNE